MFACGDAKGMVYFYNMDHSIESPQYYDKITNNQPITKLCWMNLKEKENN